ncbi:MAG: DnaA ATPase domain-containing protein [Isosphaeraceae bacterium]
MEPASHSPLSEHPTSEQGGVADVAPVERRIMAAPSGASAHPWDGYLTGPENELAMAAAQAMARGERQGISPMVVHGPSGVGKSRLLAGLVAERLRREPGSAVAHLDAETFASACAEAARAEGGVGRPSPSAGDGWPALRDRLRGVDLFVLEDLEGMERTPSAREELAHTLDALEVAGAAVAVSAKSAPGTWARREWPVRLVNRLLGGLTVRVDPPGLASRRRYVLHRAGDHGLALQAEAVERLAQAADGYRTLDGWIVRLGLEARLGGESRGRGAGRRAGGASRALDPETVATILAEEALLADPASTVDAIARAVSARFGVRLGVLRGPSRRASVVEARHLAIHLARTLTGSSFAAIGAYFSGRDPATVRHACKAAAERIEADPSMAAVVAALAGGSRKSDS